MILIPTLILLVLGFLWLQLPLKNWLVASIVVLLLIMVSDTTHALLPLILIVILGSFTALLYFLPDLRKRNLSRRLYDMFKEKLPPMSQPGQGEIDAGAIWWGAQLFSGKPDWDVLFEAPAPELNSEEQAFINGAVEELCAMVNDWEITHKLNQLPMPVWEFLKQNRFFGLNISPEYGGHGFSAHAQSCIVQKLSSRSMAVATMVMAPNSQGPAELLSHYGTPQQKKLYLPRLAAGEEAPCLALTNTWTGSDEDDMPDYGVVFEGRYKRKKVLGFRVNWTKRDITPGPVATLLGLAFKARDPDQLLGDDIELGITFALVPANTKGVSVGTRNQPLNTAFQNGPCWGKDVFIPMDWVIGGEARVGQGWRMLVECLAVGRGMSWPAAGAGAAKLAAITSGAYARIRQQSGVEPGRSEGVEEILARIGGLTWLIDAGRTLSASGLALGYKPAVDSAIVKQQSTDLLRVVINDAMDLHGDKAVCMGAGNYLARIYHQIPIGIAALGANSRMRSQIIFGQGLMHCHPYLVKEVAAVSMKDQVDGLDQFDLALVGHIEHMTGNKLRAFGYGLTRGRVSKGTGAGLIKKHSRAIEHLSASCAYLADVTFFILAGDLNRKEMLSGWFADVLGNLYLASAALKYFKDNRESTGEEPLLDWACRFALFRAQEALVAITRNYPNKILGAALRITIFPTGRYLHSPDDGLAREVARLLQEPGPIRDRLLRDVFISRAPDDVIAQMEAAFSLMVQTADLRKRLEKPEHRASPLEDYLQWLERLKSDGFISEEESDLLTRAREAVGRVIEVDDFEADSIN